MPFPQPPFGSAIQGIVAGGANKVVAVWQNWLQLVQNYMSGLTGSGPTSARPTNDLWVGQPFFDTTLNAPVYWNGSAWVTASPSGGVTAVTGTAPISSSGGTTPNISISQAGASTNGYLSSTDWNTFNSKQNTLPAANATTSGYLTSTDWNIFNNKLSNPLAITKNGSAFSPAATARPVSDMLGDYVSVKDFGAIGDDSSDDTATIQDAINALAGSGGTLFFPSGIYKTTSTLTVPNNVCFEGMGKGASYIRAHFTSGDIVQVGDGSSGSNPGRVTISNLCVTAASAMSSGAAIRVRNGHNIVLSNIQLGYNLYIGAQFDGDTYATPSIDSRQFIYSIDGFEINSGSYAGILVGQTNSGGSNIGPSWVQDIWINNGIVDGCNVGLHLINCSGVYINSIDAIRCNVGIQMYPGTSQQVRNVFCNQALTDTCLSFGWNIASGGGNVSSINIDNSWGSSTGTASGGSASGPGLVINQGTGTVKDVIISSSRFINNNGNGIRLDACSQITIDNCQCLSNSMSIYNTYYGIGIGDGVSGWSIIGGAFGREISLPYNYQKYGIWIGSGCNDYVVVGSNVQDNVSGGFANNSISASQRYIAGVIDTTGSITAPGWTLASASYAPGSTYTNNSNKPIFVSMTIKFSAPNGLGLTVNGIVVANSGGNGGPGTDAVSVNGFVPPGGSFIFSTVNGSWYDSVSSVC